MKKNGGECGGVRKGERVEWSQRAITKLRRCDCEDKQREARAPLVLGAKHLISRQDHRDELKLQPICTDLALIQAQNQLETHRWKRVEAMWNSPVCDRGLIRYRLGLETGNVGSVPALASGAKLQNAPRPCRSFDDK